MARQIEGSVVSISRSGNLVTNITADQLVDTPRDERVRISCGDHETACLLPANHNEPESTLLAMIGESGKLEIALVGMNIGQMLGLRVGEKVVVRWE